LLPEHPGSLNRGTTPQAAIGKNGSLLKLSQLLFFGCGCAIPPGQAISNQFLVDTPFACKDPSEYSASAIDALAGDYDKFAESHSCGELPGLCAKRLLRFRAINSIETHPDRLSLMKNGDIVSISDAGAPGSESCLR
jgi:hypothetical protein